jgi:hypothetical protein
MSYRHLLAARRMFVGPDRPGNDSGYRFCLRCHCFVADVRACTADSAEQGLDPNGSRTETFEWGGEAFDDGQTIFLTTDNYRLIANAGQKGESQPLEVQLIRP